MGNAIDWNKVGAIGTWCFGIVGLAIYLFDRLRQAGNMPVTLAGWSPAILIALAIFGGAALHLKAAALGSRTGRLLIHSASYGVGGAWWQWWKYKNVTEIVRACVKSDAIDISVSNTILGDPFKGDPKHLFVRYSHNGIAQRTVVPEGGRFSVPASSAESNTLPNSPIVSATRQMFESLSVSQRFLVKEIYEHPGMAIAFLGRTLDAMKFPPRVGIESLDHVLRSTNFVHRTTINAEPNATVKNIVETLLESAKLPSPETVRQINEETTAALTTDHNLGYESILGPLRAKLAEVVKERDNLVRERQSSVLISVCVVSLSVEPTTITRGKTLKIRYTVESSQDVADKIWLGASLPDKNQKWIFNRTQDKPIRLLKGLHEYDRDLTIPTGTAPGSYMLHASVWHGDLSDSAETNRVAKGKPVPIVIEA